MLLAETSTRQYWLTYAVVSAIAIVSGWACNTAGVPLGWLIGSLISTGLISIIWRDPKPPIRIRNACQMIVACAVGLNLTPATFAAIVHNFPLMLFSALALVAVSMVIGAFLVKVVGLDRSTALFAATPGGATEMALVALRFGGQGGTVAVAQTCRIAMVVMIIPPLLVHMGNTFVDFTRVPVDWDPFGLALILAIGGISGILMARTRMSNPYFIAPLFLVGIASLAGLPISHVPGLLIAIAQVGLGMAMGSMFNRAMVRSILRIMATILSMAVGLLGFGLGFSYLLAYVVNVPYGELVLATAPASVTEMALTATAMSFNAGVVTAFHIVRIMIAVPFSPMTYALFCRLVDESPTAAAPEK